jgi:hypothetical protein
MQNLEKIIYYISSLFNSLVINRRMPATCSLNRFYQKVHVTIIKNKARSPSLVLKTTSWSKNWFTHCRLFLHDYDS